MNIEETLAAIAAKGLLVNNLFQLSPGLWQANLVNAERSAAWGFAIADSAQEALEQALVAAASPETPVRLASSLREATKQPPVTLEDLGL